MKKLLTLIITIGILLPSHAQNLSEVIKLLASDRAPTDFYGYSVAISGKYAIVGSYLEDEDVTGGNNLSGAGSAYIYERTLSGTWIQIKKIVASDRRVNAQFGYSVAISGEYAIIGARWEDYDAWGGNNMFNAGAAYIFERNGGGNWLEVKKIVASDRAMNDEFGEVVSISGDYVVVGVPEEDEDVSGSNSMGDAGSAYFFKRGGNWTEMQKVVPSDRNASDQFGHAVCIDGTYAIITAWEEDHDSSGGNLMDNAGSAYVYELDSMNTWTQVQKIVAPDRSPYDKFGFSVSVSGDYAILGAAYEDDDAAGNNPMGNAGSAYFFERDNTGVWNQDQKIVASDRSGSDNFGWAVSVDGNLAIIGAMLEDEDSTGSNTLNDAGSGYVFRRDGPGLWNELNKLVPSDREIDDLFGVSVSISGSYAIIGANLEDHDAGGLNFMTNSGSAYIFESCMSGSILTASACGSYISPSTNYTWVSSGTYTDTLLNSSSCDSIITVNLTITNSSSSNINIVACDSYTSPSGTSIWTTSGTYADTVANMSGCDSVITVNLTVNSSNTTSVTASACNSYTSPSGNFTWVSSGTYQDTMINSAGCDSVITVVLSINSSGSANINASGCSSYNSPSGNYTWSSSGTYIDTIPTLAGCDSIITVNLTIGIASSTLNPSVCNSYLSPSGNYTWTVSGTFTDTIPAAAGCDSIITVMLTINNNSNSSISPSACESYTSPSGNYTWTASGTFADTIPAANGCDSIITVMLTINNNSSTNISVSSCGSYTSPSGNYTWTSSGIYTDTIPTSTGCDSIITINLAVTTVDVSVTASGTSLTATAAASTFQWLACGTGYSVIVGENAPTFNLGVTGSFAVQVTSNGCIDTSACFNITQTGISQLELRPELLVYPNPGNGIFTVRTIEKPNADYSLRVVDLLGREVFNSGHIQAEHTVINQGLDIDLSSQSSGIYQLQIFNSQGMTTQKLIIE